MGKCSTLLVMLASVLVSVSALAAPTIDFDGDRVITSQDLPRLADEILGKASLPGGDVNSDGRTDISDLVWLSNWINKGPDDPAPQALPSPMSAPLNFTSATQFLYSGANPIQRGVAPGTIASERAAVLRGRVLNELGQPLSGVTISILDHPEFGLTLSRADGRFDLAVNGGGLLHAQYAVPGYLTVQRQIDVSWNAYGALPDVMLTRLDPRLTPVDLTSTATLVAQGSRTSDDEGTRTATMIIQPATVAWMRMENGTTQPLSNLGLRFTEYTRGWDGPLAMPADLPSPSAYTYCAELTVDQALSAGAVGVHFNKPIYYYLENYRNFPVGSSVPVGSYNRLKGQWEASENGRVIRILSISQGLANLDLAGQGIAASPEELSGSDISTEERRKLAQLYQPGQSLWRVPVKHFSPLDLNFPWGFPPDAFGPNGPPPRKGAPGGGDGGNGPGGGPPPKDPCQKHGSIIEPEIQALGDMLPVSGTPFMLRYTSTRVPDNRESYRLAIPVSGPEQFPPSMVSIQVRIEVAGRVFNKTFAPMPNLTYDFEWDGKDIYGRFHTSPQRVKSRISYEYEAVYLAGPMTQAMFGRGYSVPDNVALASGSPMAPNTRRSISQEWEGYLGGWDQRVAGFGGWSLSEHHIYDPASQVVYRGDGTIQNAGDLGTVIKTVAGTGQQAGGSGIIGENGPALKATISYPYVVSFGPDGTLYFTHYREPFLDMADSRVMCITPDGILKTVAGNETPGDSGDGGLARNATLDYPQDIKIGADGSVYILTRTRIRKITPDGIIRTIAGTGERFQVPPADGTPATKVSFDGYEMDLAPDGSIYLIASARLFRIDPSGLMTRIAGAMADTGDPRWGDGGFANRAFIHTMSAVAVGPDGSVYISDLGRIRKITPDGIINTIGGTGIQGQSGDGGPATQAQVYAVEEIEIGKDGSIYFMDGFPNRVRVITPDGLMGTLAGGGTSQVVAENEPALQLNIFSSTALALSPNGDIYIVDKIHPMIRKLTSPYSAQGANVKLVPSEDGGEIYVFDPTGRHLRTLLGLTGTLLYEFKYNLQNLLIEVSDALGNKTTIERNVSGLPTAIVAPRGQRTALLVNSNGFLTTFAPPGLMTTNLSYTTGGLLTMMGHDMGLPHRFSYDDDGRLLRDEAPGGVITSLQDGFNGSTNTLAMSSTLNRVTLFSYQALENGLNRSVVTSPSGAETLTVTEPEKGRLSIRHATGVQIEAVEGPDPRFGMAVPLYKQYTMTLPGGLSSTLKVERSVTYADPDNLLSLQTMTNKMSVNGRPYLTTYDLLQDKITLQTPMGRMTEYLINEFGWPLQMNIDPQLHPVKNSYDGTGRLNKIEFGPQSFSYSYNSQGDLASRIDALGNQVQYSYDSGGRLAETVMPGGGHYAFTYDHNSNLVQIKMPNNALHSMSYSAMMDHGMQNLLASYVPPGSIGYNFAYSPDREPIRTTLPSGRQVAFNYDPHGRPVGLSYAEATTSLTYPDATNRVSRLSRTPTGGGPAQHIDFVYDGGLTTQIEFNGPAQGRYRYEYDNSLAVTSSEFSSAAETISIMHGYDLDGRLVNIGPFSWSRNGPAGLVSRITDGTMQTDFSYDQLGYRSTIRQIVNGSIVSDIALTYDNAGRLSTRTETLGGATKLFAYTYSAAGYLAQVTENGAVAEVYQYDVNGNRTSQKLGNSPVNAASFNQQDQILSQGSLNYTTDQDGFVTARGGDAFSYSAHGELLTATVGGQNVTYGYDGLGRRTSRTRGASTEQYFWGRLTDDFLLTASRDGAGVLSIYFYDEADQLIAIQRGRVYYYVMTDLVGSPRLITNSSGIIVRQIDYDSYGNIKADSNPLFNLPIGFGGGLTDPETGLVRFGLRDYDPISGRWMARDPSLFGGEQGNLYTYVGNSPVNGRDLSGLFTVGGSAYEGYGGGGKLTITKDGLSACFEVGFGLGRDTTIDPFSDKLDDNKGTLELDVSASAYFIGAGANLSLDTDGCLKGKVKGNAGPLKVEKSTTEDSMKVSLKNPFKMDSTKYGDPTKKSMSEMHNDTIKSDNGKIKLQGTLKGTVCQNVRW